MSDYEKEVQRYQQQQQEFEQQQQQQAAAQKAQQEAEKNAPSIQEQALKNHLEWMKKAGIPPEYAPVATGGTTAQTQIQTPPMPNNQYSWNKGQAECAPPMVAAPGGGCMPGPVATPGGRGGYGGLMNAAGLGPSGAAALPPGGLELPPGLTEGISAGALGSRIPLVRGIGTRALRGGW